MPRPGTGLVGWTVMREMTDVQICRSKIAGDTRRKCEEKNIMNPESCWVVPSRSRVARGERGGRVREREGGQCLATSRFGWRW